ncbi:MAG: hypothetical protein JW750_11320 [Anaerolineaceae bacterium]|nr:hypothetical protein [Anaerolineaceae bacterium]
MDFFGELLGWFIIIIVAFGLAALAGTLIRKSKTSGYKKYLVDNFPHLPPDIDMLIAKRKSKQIKPDIALILPDTGTDILLLLNESGRDITHKAYTFDELVSVESTHQMIARGAMPKTWSYEETLSLGFNDGKTYHLILENVSNKTGSDQGAVIVKNMIAPYKNKLMAIMEKKE